MKTDAYRTSEPRCAHCGAGLDGSLKLIVEVIGECDCAAKTPTVPVFRDARDHLPDCNLRRTAYAMIRTISVSLNMRPEVTP